MKRKIYEKQVVDFETGELISSTSVSASKFYETFLMARNTETLDWLYQLSGNEIKTIVFFSDLEEIPKGENNTGQVIMYLCKYTVSERKRLASILNCSDRYLRRLIASLESKGWLIEVNKHEYLLNPAGFYKGPSKEVVGRIKEFNRLLAAKNSVQRLSETSE